MASNIKIIARALNCEIHGRFKEELPTLRRTDRKNIINSYLRAVSALEKESPYTNKYLEQADEDEWEDERR